MSQKSQPELIFKDLACSRGGRVLLSGLSHSLTSNSVTLLKGPNGSGKSSFLRMLAGFSPLHAGHIIWQDEDVTWDREILTKDMIYLGHAHALKTVLTLEENLRYYADIVLGTALSKHDIEKAAANFDMVDLLHVPVSCFSSGQRHRAGLIRFALCRRTIWLMDEPTVGLDQANRKRLASLMWDHCQSGGLILAASHDPLGLDCEELDIAAYTPTYTLPEFEESWS